MLDSIDKIIIEQLQADGRMTTSDLAQIAGLSVPAVGERIKKLQENGIILGFTAVINPKKVGLDVGATITVVSESSANYSDVIERASNHPEVIECMSVTGVGSHVLVVRTENTGTLENLLRQVQSWPGVVRTDTRLILSHYKEHGVLQVPDAVIKH